MAETADELGLVEGVRSHLHTTHGLHLPVHGQEVITSDLYLEVGLFALVGAERVLMKTDGEGMGWVGRRLLELGSVSRSLDAAQTELRLESSEYKQQWPEKKTYDARGNTRASQRSHLSKSRRSQLPQKPSKRVRVNDGPVSELSLLWE